MKRKWYCYVCGGKLKDKFYLWSLNERTDRVFLTCLKDTCIGQLSDNPIVVKVSELVKDIKWMHEMFKSTVIK